MRSDYRLSGLRSGAETKGEGGEVSWRFVKAKFKVGDVVRFPYGKRIGKITAVGEQVVQLRDGVDTRIGFLYRITTYTLTDQQLHRVRKKL